MSYVERVTELLRAHECVCGVSVGRRAFDITPHPRSGLLLELFDDGRLAKRTHYELPPGKESDMDGLLAAHAAAYAAGDAWWASGEAAGS